MRVQRLSAKLAGVGVGVFFVILAVVVFRCALGQDNVFNGSDTNIGLIAANHRVLPERFVGVHAPTPALGDVSAIPFSLFNIGRWLLPPDVFSNTWYAFYLVLSSSLLVAYLRLWAIRWSACMVGALTSYWMGSITLATAGHLNKLGVMMLFTLALFLLEKAVRAARGLSRVLWSTLGGMAVGFMLLEQQDVAFLAGCFLAAYVMARLALGTLHEASHEQKNSSQPNGVRGHVVNWLTVLLPVAVCGLLLSGAVATKAYTRNVTDAGLNADPAHKWDFITQWSMVPAEWPDFIAPGYTGWNSGNPKGPYWGKVGQSKDWERTGKGFQNFRLDNVYLGIIPMLLALYAVSWACTSFRKSGPQAKLMLLWGLLACVALLLSFGKYSPLYKLYYHLPLVGNIRAPIKFLHNFQMMVGILAAFGLHHWLARETRSQIKVLGVLGGIGLLIGIAAITPSAEQFSQWGEHAEVIAQTTRGAWLHALIMLLCCLVLIGLANKVAVVRKNGAYAIVLLLAMDSVMLTSKYFSAKNIRTLRDGNIVIDYLVSHQGNDRVFLMDSRGVYSRWISTDAGYHGLNLFNIWQMPRMAADLKAFLQASGKSQLRLFQLSSVKYVVAPASILPTLPDALKTSLRPVLFYRFVPGDDWPAIERIEHPIKQGDQVLLEYSDALPRFSLHGHWREVPLDQHLNTIYSPEFNPLSSLIVEPVNTSAPARTAPYMAEEIEADVSLKDAVAQTSMGEPAVLMFTQRYQPEWRVEVDGEPAEIIRCNHLFMGVYVPAGEHEVRFYID